MDLAREFRIWPSTVVAASWSCTLLRTWRLLVQPPHVSQNLEGPLYVVMLSRVNLTLSNDLHYCKYARSEVVTSKSHVMYYSGLSTLRDGTRIRTVNYFRDLRKMKITNHVMKSRIATPDLATSAGARCRGFSIPSYHSGSRYGRVQIRLSARGIAPSKSSGLFGLAQVYQR